MVNRLDKEETPVNLRPYIFHGVELGWKKTDKEATGDCPWCGREGKFSVNIETGKWRCFLCDEGTQGKTAKGGNAYVFVRMLQEKSFEATTPEDYAALAVDRRLLYPEGLVEAQLARSIITGHWLVPGYDPESKLMTLYKYDLSESGERKMLWPTPTLGHRLLMMNLFDRAAQTVYLLEGIWDSLKFFEIAARLKPSDSGAIPTSNRSVSYMNDASVIGIAAAKTLFAAMKDDYSIFAEKDVVLLGHNDHERIHPKTKKKVEAASWTGMKAIAEKLDTLKERPNSINILRWDSEKGYNTELPSGYDVRDKLSRVVVSGAS